MSTNDTRSYQALAVPTQPSTDGGVEILRVGLINDELFVSARRAFKAPGRWGEVLADIARRLALFEAGQDTDLTEREILIEIEEAFAAELGARAAASKRAKPKKSNKARRPVRRKAAKQSASGARRRKRR